MVNMIKRLFYNWRYYMLGHDEYKKCLDKIFFNNLYGLRQANTTVAVVGALFTMFPLIIERNYPKAAIHSGLALVALFFRFIVSHKCQLYMKGKQVSNRFIYGMIVAFYVNVIIFGIYLGVWANPGKLAVSYMGILICALFLFNIPPLLNLCLTIGAMGLFITATIMVKPFRDSSLDVVNSLFAGCISQYFGWQIVMFRMSLASTANKLEEERNSYYNQSTVDELTQLKNRRDFMQTFQRFLTNYRQSDSFICIALLDIDFFKNYNDHYGHPQGDECLRSVGKTLGDLHESMSIYAARVGGEEFALIWFEKEISNSNSVAAMVNQKVSDLNIPHAKSRVAPYVTISIGVHVAPCGAFHDINTLYDLADKALYSAKRTGRNRAVVSS